MYINGNKPGSSHTSDKLVSINHNDYINSDQRSKGISGTAMPVIVVYQPRPAKQQEHDTALSATTAVYQQRSAKHDSRVSNICISTASINRDQQGNGNYDTAGSIILAVYQRRSRTNDGCIPTATSEAVAAMTQPCRQQLYINRDQRPTTAISAAIATTTQPDQQ